MSGALDTRAEIEKLARLLEVEPDRLDYLRAVSAEDLAVFRDQVTQALFDRTAAGLKRMAAASGLMPGSVAAAIAQRVLGPMLCARLAGLVDPGKAVDTAKHLPPAFLADVAIQIDPRRAKDVIVRLPAPLVAQGAGELVRREEYVTMGRFVGYLTDDAIRAAMVEIDPESMLRVGFVMEGKERLDHVTSLLPDEKFARMVGAAESVGLWTEALDLFEHLGPELQARFEEEAATHEGFLENLEHRAAEEAS